ncbi:MAG TPA: sialidase family protein [Acidimicrobiales bacterium]|nr:sialidase family protein [Acidimicrobiales bacterium]
MACAAEIGYPTSEPSIVVTNGGVLVFSPAQTENSVALSTDHGASWHLAYPPDEQYTALWNTDDPYLTVDRRTGRVFWVHATGPLRTAPLVVSESPLPGGLPTVLAAAYGFQVYSTADEGRSWTTADYQTAPTGDWEKVFVGAPRAPRTGAPQPVGYPDVVYVCANSPLEVAGPGRLCYRSLDGARTFVPAGYIFPSLTAPLSCPALATNNGVVSRDGTVYQPVGCSDGSYVAVSTDEGGTYRWHKLPQAPGTGAGVDDHNFQIAIDGADQLYALWVCNGVLCLATSADGATSWSTPLRVAAPAVRSVTFPQLAAGPAGHVGVVYYGTRSTTAQRLTAYITESNNARDQRPIFISGALNDPARPIFVDYGLTGGSPRADYVGAAYDPSGVLWAGLVKLLSTPDASGNVRTAGYVGRLAG